MNDVNRVNNFSGGISEKSSSVMTGIGGLYRDRFEEISDKPVPVSGRPSWQGIGIDPGSIDIKSINRYYGRFGEVWLMLDVN